MPVLTFVLYCHCLKIDFIINFWFLFCFFLLFFLPDLLYHTYYIGETLHCLKCMYQVCNDDANYETMKTSISEVNLANKV